jgi:integrase
VSEPKAPLLVQVFKRGKRWWVRYTFGGQQVRRPARTTRREEAEALASKIHSELFAGVHFPEKRSARAGELTMKGLEKLWLEHAANKKSVATDRARFSALVDYFGKDTRIDTLEPSDVEKLKAQLLARPARQRRRADAVENSAEQGVGFEPADEGAEPAPNATKATLSPASVNRHLELLRAALRVAKANGYRHRDPMAGVKFLRLTNARDRICTPEEFERLVEAANPKLRLAIQLAYWTAMRLGEITNLVVGQVNLERRIVTLSASDTKTGRPRKVPLPEATIPILEAAVAGKASSVRLFDIPANSLSPLFSRLCRRLEPPIEDLRLHDMRHSALTRLRRSGQVDVFTLAAISGHRSLAMLQRYNTVTEEDLVEAITRADRGVRPAKPRAQKKPRKKRAQ